MFKEMTTSLRKRCAMLAGRQMVSCVCGLRENIEGGGQNRVRYWVPLPSKIVKVPGQCFLRSGLKGCIILKVFIFVDLSQRWRAGKIAKNRQEAVQR